MFDKNLLREYYDALRRLNDWPTVWTAFDDLRCGESDRFYNAILRLYGAMKALTLNARVSPALEVVYGGKEETELYRVPDRVVQHWVDYWPMRYSDTWLGYNEDFRHKVAKEIISDFAPFVDFVVGTMTGNTLLLSQEDLKERLADYLDVGQRHWTEPPHMLYVAMVITGDKLIRDTIDTFWSVRVEDKSSNFGDTFTEKVLNMSLDHLMPLLEKAGIYDVSREQFKEFLMSDTKLKD